MTTLSPYTTNKPTKTISPEEPEELTFSIGMPRAAVADSKGLDQGIANPRVGSNRPMSL